MTLERHIARNPVYSWGYGVLSQTVVCDRGQVYPEQARSGLALMAARILLNPQIEPAEGVHDVIQSMVLFATEG